MEGIIIFVRPLPVCDSTSLTAFLQQSFPNLTPNYMQLSPYYSQQSEILLAQISAQLAVSGSPPPANIFLPPPFPGFHVTPLDVGVNIFWFMSLVFSLTAVLATTISIPLQRRGKVVHLGGSQCSPALPHLHLSLPVLHWHWTCGLSSG
ncbi:hypothetical protein EDB92DRAFT_1895998 [Lactarius akahatsu]|uniref:DUF6535 domain-containing protein n=1 Tax=Lactarius akahatsu TaxID=416441 RepID=A0AAD4LA24_9AGAM|nr:hypothetical protein EDB92DRAFT_1895998 [Lactarius akahatsu]